MKIFSEDIAGSGKKRVLLATGLDELELMYGFLERTRLNYPIGEKWAQDGNRLKNIVSELKAGIILLKEGTTENGQIN